MSISETAMLLIELVKAVINSNKDKIVCKHADYKALLEMAKRQGVCGIIGSIIDMCDDVPDEIKRGFVRAYKMNICRDAKRDILVTALLKLFENNGVDCMPLKGYILKNMYPAVEMRDMCDVDILIHTKDYEKAKELMTEIGFIFEKETEHEYIFFSNDKITIELHKSIVSSANPILYNYYGDGWQFGTKKTGYEHLYEMKFEDFYVYEIAHIAKHYLNGGIGIRHIADLYILKGRLDKYDTKYIETQFEILGIKKFHKIISRLCMTWFANLEYDDETFKMAEYIINGALYGIYERSQNARILRLSDVYFIAVLKSFFSYIFPKRIGLIKGILSLRKSLFYIRLL